MQPVDTPRSAMFLTLGFDAGGRGIGNTLDQNACRFSPAAETVTCARFGERQKRR